MGVAVRVMLFPVLQPTPNPAYYFTDSPSISVTSASGNQIYICSFDSNEQLSSISWQQATNTLYTSIGTQSSNTCSASISSPYGSIIGSYGITVPTTANTVYSSSVSTSGNGQLEFSVTNSINTIVIAMAIGGDRLFSNPPAPLTGCSVKLDTIDSSGDGIYYEICTNLTPNNYSITFPSYGNPTSAAVFVYETPVLQPTPNPAYYFTDSPSISVTAASGNEIYFCEGGTYNQLSSVSWQQTTNTLYTSIGTQSSNICTDSLPSPYDSIIGIYGITVPTTTNTIYSYSSASPPTLNQLQFTVANSINTVVIAFTILGGRLGSPSIPSGCFVQLDKNDNNGNGVYFATCNDLPANTYTINYAPYGQATSTAVFVYEIP